MAESWFVLNSKPQKENLLCQQLKLRGLETYYPRLHVKPVNPRSRRVIPYFPGYLFVHVDLDEFGFSKLAWIPGLKRMITFGGEPAKVSEVIIETLRKNLAQQNNISKNTRDELKSGQPVQIIDSRFKGYEAIFDAHLDGTGRVRILLKLLNDHHVPLELPETKIRRK